MSNFVLVCLACGHEEAFNNEVGDEDCSRCGGRVKVEPYDPYYEDYPWDYDEEW